RRRQAGAWMMLRLGFTGDVCLGGQLRELIALHGPEFPFTGAAPALLAVDLLVGNLECCLIRDSTGPEARRFMAVPAAHADGLRAAGFHTMSLADNHMMDCGTDGLTATLARLGDLGHGAAGPRATRRARPGRASARRPRRRASRRPRVQQLPGAVACAALSLAGRSRGGRRRPASPARRPGNRAVPGRSDRLLARQLR